MNREPSLSEEKQALLAKMQASRVAYRRMLLGIDQEQQSEAVEAVVPTARTFPRSKTFRWIRDHPFLTAFAVAALVIGPRRVARTAVKSGRTSGAVIARNQHRIRTALTIASAIARLASRRR